MSGKVRRAASVLYSGETVLGKGNADEETGGQNSFEARRGWRKMEKFIPASSEENLRPLEMPDCIYFDGAVQVRNSQCKRVFEKAVSLFFKAGRNGKNPCCAGAGA